MPINIPISKTRILSKILFKVIKSSEFYWACVYKVTTVLRNNSLSDTVPSIYISLTLMEVGIGNFFAHNSVFRSPGKKSVIKKKKFLWIPPSCGVLSLHIIFLSQNSQQTRSTYTDILHSFNSFTIQVCLALF